ncbi:hypothetical protein JT359_09290 [Candidatus Poribacteria bacterium]|nr:hypothetical protein [Candidatus Poribacteria bacterium]
MNYKKIIITIIISCIINIPSLTHAIRNQTVQYTETATLQNETIQEQAKSDAEKDAIQNTNSFVWFGTGLGCCVTTSVCTLAGCYIGSITKPTPLIEDDINDILFYDSTQIGDGSCLYENGCMDEGCLLGAVFGALIPIIGIYNYKTNPSPDKLIGKSAEYVEEYTKAYKKKTRSIRRNMAAAGFTTGCLSLASFILLSD